MFSSYVIRVNCVSYISCCLSVCSSFGSATPHATTLFFYFYVMDFIFMFFLYVFPFFQCGDFGHLSSTCLKPADSSKSSSRRDGDSSTCDEVECDLIHLLSCCGDEFSAKGGSSGVKGRLQSSFNFWVETLDAPDFVLDMIRRGYRLPFAEYPSQCFLKNNRSALQHPEFVADAISELLSNGCIVEHEFPPYCVNPLTVAVGKKLRLVIDLRHVNNY